MAGEIALRILGGEEVKNIPVVKTGSSRYEFDYRQMKRFGIKLSALPEGSIVINKPSSFYWENRRKVWLAISIIAGFFIVIFLLSANIIRLRRAEQALRVASRYNRSLIEASVDPLVTIDPSGKITDVNTATEKLTGCLRKELIGSYFSDYFTEPDRAKAGYEKVLHEGSVRNYALEIQNPDGHVTPVLYNASIYRNELGKVEGVFAAVRDITERRRAQKELQEAHDKLEQRVEKRTADLARANEQLRREILERKRVEQALRERGEELELKTIDLEEANTTLKVLLKKMHADKREVEEKIFSNVNELINPYLERLMKSGLDQRQMDLFRVVISNIDEITSPFSLDLRLKYTGLTPKEIQIAGLVKEGKTTKEIAELLTSSTDAIEFHRKNLRKKLGLKNAKLNLRSYLLSSPDQ